MSRLSSLLPAFAPLLPRRAMSAPPRRRSTRLSSSDRPPAPASAAPKRRRRATRAPSLPPPDPMALPAPLTRCVLVRRYKRFLADVELPSGEVVTAHCPNPGSMRGMGVDARPDALVSTAPLGSKRKLPYTLEALQVDRVTWVGVNTVKPNAVVGAWLEARGADAVALFGEYAVVRREVKYGVGGGSRIDFVLEYGGDAAEALPYYVEVKNVTMSWDDDGGAAGAVERVAVFPDSKTERGQKHLRELADVVERGLGRACVLYFVNRADAVAFAPCTVDPKYVALFDEAKTAGVKAFPLAFDLAYDEASGSARFAFGRTVPIHPRTGP